MAQITVANAQQPVDVSYHRGIFIYIYIQPFTNHTADGHEQGLRCALATELGLQNLLKDGDERAERELGRATYFMRDAKAQADAGLSEDEQGGIHYWDSVAVNHVSFDRHL